ncbi:related to PNP1 - purine-nucleoside phosphorylase [Melanopsichium pennsylvanicum]|uniref:Purine nucleoside phosphorylase n=2 Tax=Melanopsichium pennsylvanicum TaxID=63383 RepID=A0AAJ4XR79_9BASI|nr:related to PNP1-purine-nucleoside phosphorylase [Melanopsichium pennsylvanicum 4]SNX87759.1 related to PNP1 - purine-nucleoside phosphorylase [Melanopsichium pennsylvanicum]
MGSVNITNLPEPFGSAVQAIRATVPVELASPKWGIICGSGLSGLANSLESSVHVPYTSIPGFSESTVEGHKSSLAFGFITSDSIKVPVVACLGRFHTYEGHSAAACVFPTRVMKLLGVTHLIVTNAAGGLADSFQVGTIMAIHDHISLPTLTSMNPLIGANLSALGPRFPPLSNAYDLELRLSLYRAAQKLGLTDSIQSGTYAYVLGPSYESRADARFLKSVGADAVGMSTVPEVIAATHAGMKVLAISLITNKVVLKPYFDFQKALKAEENGGENVETLVKNTLEKDVAEAANHQEVLEAGAKRAQDMTNLVAQVVCGTNV